MKPYPYKVVGHRGFPERYPENSIAGIEAAIAAGAEGIEFDVQLSKDGECVVIHDETLERVTDVTGNVYDLTLAQLQNISAHEPKRFGDQHFPQYLPSLKSLSDRLKNYKGQVFVELKEFSITQFNAEIFLEKAVEATESIAQQRVIISFNYDILVQAKQRYGLPVGWVIREHDAEVKAKVERLQPDVIVFNKKRLPRAPLWQGPWEWFVYDVVELALAQELYEKGILYIETNNVDLYQ